MKKTNKTFIVKFNKTTKKQEVFSVATGKKLAGAAAMACIEKLRKEREARKAQLNIRPSVKVADKAKAKAFALRAFDTAELLRPYAAAIVELNKFTYEKNDPEKNEKLKKARALWKSLEDQVKADMNKPFEVRRVTAVINRLNRSTWSDVTFIDYEDKRPTDKWISVEANFQDAIACSWLVAGTTKEAGFAAIDKLTQMLENRKMASGVVVKSAYGDKKYAFLYASASDQKKAVAKFVEVETKKSALDVINFGKTSEEVISDDRVNAAAKQKEWANLARPIAEDLLWVDGTIIEPKDILVIPDVEIEVLLPNARTIGGTRGGKIYADGAVTTKRIVNDGTAHIIVPEGTENIDSGCKNAQTSGLCIKDEAVMVEYTNEELNVVVNNIDGKPCRVGDFKMIMGEGCWKADKEFKSWADYVAYCESLETTYPGISRIHVLRQADEVEEETRIRRTTRTLNQQFMMLSAHDERELTKRTRQNLKKMMTIEGAVNTLSGAYKENEDKSESEMMFQEAPWLVLNENVQMYQKNKFESILAEAIGGKHRTEGSFPYITEDPKAVKAMWLYGKNPNTEQIGALTGDEISMSDIPDNFEVGALRFPANYLTAKVMTNKSCNGVREYKYLNNVCAISIYSDLLIRQDGDVDGDEMAIYTNKLIVRLIKLMHYRFNPPVIVFAHGAKAERKAFGTRENYIKELSMALWRAKKFDKVGPYANLAMRCAYLASIYYKRNDTKMVDRLLLWMSIASTGAILAIDQVKGNAVDPAIIDTIDKIRLSVNSMMREEGTTVDDNGMMIEGGINPWIQSYIKKDVDPESCNPENDDNVCDSLGGFVKRDVGEWNFYTGGAVWNNEAAKRALLNNNVRRTTIRAAALTEKNLGEIEANWFNTKNEADKATSKLIHEGKPVGQKPLLLLLWRNECAMAYRMEGKTLSDKKCEYYNMVHDVLFAQADSIEWKRGDDGYVYSSDEKHALVVNAAVSDALELDNRGNGIDADKKGSYAMFILRVFSREIRANVLANKPSWKEFFPATMSTEDLLVDVEIENILDEEPLYEEAPADVFDRSDEDASVLDDGTFVIYSDEEIPDEAYDYEEAVA